MKPAMIATSAFAVAALTLSACGSDSVDAVADETSGVVVEELTIDGVWARESPMMANTGAAYMDITSDIDDRLVGASVDASIAGRVEIHEVVLADDTMDDGSMEDGEMSDDTAMADEEMAEGEMDDDEMHEGAVEGAMVMQEIEALELPAGEAVMLKPGGYHIMLLELAEPLVDGTSFDLTLDLAEAGQVTVVVEVRTEAP